jgi:hypothetical protein
MSVIESRETSINSQQDPQKVDRLDKPSILDDVWICLRRVSHWQRTDASKQTMQVLEEVYLGLSSEQRVLDAL